MTSKTSDIEEAFNELNDLDKNAVLVKLLRDYKKENPLGFIERTVCSHLKVQLQVIKTDTRKPNIVLARQLIMFFARKYTNLSLVEVGKQVGNKDHATVIHACKRIEEMIADNPLITELVHKITEELNQVMFSKN